MHLTLLLQRVLVVGRAHRGSGFGGFAAAAGPIAICAVDVRVLAALSCSGALGLALAILLNESLNFRLANAVKPGLGKSFHCSEALFGVHHQHALQALERFRGHFSHVAAL